MAITINQAELEHNKHNDPYEELSEPEVFENETYDFFTCDEELYDEVNERITAFELELGNQCDKMLNTISAMLECYEDIHDSKEEALLGPRDDREELCSSCAGSGEGRYDGAKCSDCGGSGTFTLKECYYCGNNFNGRLAYDKPEHCSRTCYRAGYEEANDDGRI